MNRACFPKEKHQNSQKWAKFMNFSFWALYLVWFAGATPDLDYIQKNSLKRAWEGIFRGGEGGGVENRDHPEVSQAGCRGGPKHERAFIRIPQKGSPGVASVCHPTAICDSIAAIPPYSAL